MRVMCGLQLKDRERDNELMLILGVHETLNQLVMSISVCWYGHVLSMYGGHILRRGIRLTG